MLRLGALALRFDQAGRDEIDRDGAVRELHGECFRQPVEPSLGRDHVSSARSAGVCRHPTDIDDRTLGLLERLQRGLDEQQRRFERHGHDLTPRFE